MVQGDCTYTDGCFQIFYEGKRLASNVSQICSPRTEGDCAMSEDDDDLDKDLLGKQVNIGHVGHIFH